MFENFSDRLNISIQKRVDDRLYQYQLLTKQTPKPILVKVE
jgi:hypothetical protein